MSYCKKGMVLFIETERPTSSFRSRTEKQLVSISALKREVVAKHCDLIHGTVPQQLRQSLWSEGFTPHPVAAGPYMLVVRCFGQLVWIKLRGCKFLPALALWSSSQRR